MKGDIGMKATFVDKPTNKPKFRESPLLSFIVPMYDLKPDILKRCLMSLEDQDYEKIEVVCVLDGPNAELKKVCDSFVEKDPIKFRVVQIEHAGACAARNAGFEASKGEIVSFFNSDYVANPGMARLWVDALQDHPDCGFAYGAYEYAANHSWAYPSKKFDPWVLEIANYIDCGFPLWRKYAVKWDPAVKSLQDWDFWLRVVKEHNVKGFYLGRDISFVAEPPRPGGLSMDSSSNWIDRVNFVKKKNDIPIRDMVVTSIGAPNHGIEIAKMIGADYRDDTIYKPQEYKSIYMIGFYMKPSDQVNGHAEILRHFGKAKKIIHFVGADIYWLRKFSFENLKYVSGALNHGCDHVLCENDISRKELAEFGIKAQVVPIPSYSTFNIQPLPAKFSVSIFLTDQSDFDKYAYEHTLSIVRAMPDVQFTAYGDAGQDCHYPNLKHYGSLSRQEWEKYVYKNSCLFRIVRHDTMPMASNEFILAGRDVITNIPAKFMEVIDTSGREELNEWDMFGSGLNPYRWPETKKKIVQKIREVRDNPMSEVDQLEAHDYYAKLLDRENYIRTIKELARA